MSAVNKFFSEDYELGGILREYEVVINENGDRPFRAIKPTGVVSIGGEKYKLSERTPRRGDKVLVTLFNREQVAEIRKVIKLNKDYMGDFMMSEEVFGSEYFDADHDKCFVLEPIGETSSQDIHDLIANLVRRVKELEENVFELILDADNRDQIIESLESDIVLLDERTQPLNALTEAVKKRRTAHVDKNRLMRQITLR